MGEPMRARWIVLVVVVGSLPWLAGPRPARAQAGGPPPMTDTQREEARGLFGAGRAAFADGRFEDALDYFRRSYEISRLPDLLFNIGHAAELLHRNEEAIEAFEQYLRDAETTADDREQVSRRLARLRALVEEDRAEGPDPAEDAVGAGESEEPEELEEPADGEGSLGVGSFVVMGSGAAAAVAGIVVLALAADAGSRVTDAPRDAAWMDYQGDWEDSGTLSIAGGVLLGVGVAAVAAGAVWLVVELTGGDGEDAVEGLLDEGRLSARF